jgi:hypothetical protein
VSDLVTSTGTGVLIFGQREARTRYQVHTTQGGRPVMIELFDRPADLPPDMEVHVLLADGRVIGCRILDESSICAVVGEGRTPA